MQQKKDSFVTTFKKNILPRMFFKFSAKRVFSPLGHIFNKVNKGIVQMPDEVGRQDWPGR